MIQRQSQRLLQLGVLLLLLGLATGLTVPMLENPRMALASHLQGITNGLVLIALGLLWSRLVLVPGALITAFWMSVYGTWANWLATLLAAAWGAGAMMPLAGGGREGSPLQELVVNGLLVSLSAAMLIACSLVLVGLSRGPRRPA